MEINLPRWVIDELDAHTDTSVKAYIRRLIIEHTQAIKDINTLNGPLDGDTIEESVNNGKAETTDQKCIH